jgi:hypothetical protein
MVTMDEIYGDGSEHEACEVCGTCLECDGCQCEEIVMRVLEDADGYLSNDEIASELYMEEEEVSGIVNDLVEDGKVSEIED